MKLPPGWKSKRYDELSSTMDCCRENFNGTPLIVTATRQTTGRGRQGKSWVALEGNLFLTLGIRLNQTVGRLLGLSVAAGGKIVEKLRQEFALNLYIKWPNDLMDSSGRKLGGILIESLPQGVCSRVFIGVGINVACAPSGLDQGTTCLADLSPKNILLKKVSSCVVQGLYEATNAFEAGSQADLFPSLDRFLLWRGSSVVVSSNGYTKEGKLMGLNTTGALRLDCNGQEELVMTRDDISLRSKE